MNRDEFFAKLAPLDDRRKEAADEDPQAVLDEVTDLTGLARDSRDYDFFHSDDPVEAARR